MVNKYSRQTTLKDFGQQGQDALAKAKVLVVGAGGLGCPVLQYLVSMGVGTIGIIDDDVVSITNLHRQILYGIKDIGLPKVKVAKEKLHELNDEVQLVAYQERISQVNAVELISAYDIIIDCSDNFSTRYLINDACVLYSKPLVYGAVSSYEGQVAVFNYKNKDLAFSNNYRDLYPTMPREGEIQNCAEAGVLGVLPGIIGTLQASEVIKVITGIGQPLVNRILCYNMLQQQVMTFEYNKQVEYSGPKDINEYLNFNYQLQCDMPNKEIEIDLDTLKKMFREGGTICIDVRQEYEMPKINEVPFKPIELGDLSKHFKEIEKGNIVFICQSGARSLKAVELAQKHFNENRFYSLKGGIFGNYSL